MFFLVTDNDKLASVQRYSRPIGFFGFVVTLGLFFYELYGIKKCTHLIGAGKELEEELAVNGGQFSKRPHGVAGVINEPLPSGVIYPAVLAAWTLALVFSRSQEAATWWALCVFVIGFAFSFTYDFILILEWDKKISGFLKARIPFGFQRR